MLSGVQVSPQPPPYRPTTQRARFALGETIRASLVALFVQHRDGGSPLAPWHEEPVAGVFLPGSPVPATTIPDPYFEVVWDLAASELHGNAEGIESAPQIGHRPGDDDAMRTGLK